MKKFKTALTALAATGTLLAGIITATAQTPKIDVEELTDTLYVLYGPGGNIGMSAGEDGIFLIDDKFDQSAQLVLDAIREVNDGKIRFVINTHYHGDHTGANVKFADLGAVIIAQDKLRGRLVEAGQMPEAGLPVVTFNDQASIHLNGYEARIAHFPAAHTDGDSVVIFKGANLIHTGDIYFRSLFPYIDANGGGTVNGMIDALQAILDMSDENTIIIPGHGKVTDKTVLSADLEMLKTLRDRVKALKDNGASLEDALGGNVPEGYSDYVWGFINAERIVTAIYNTL
jgi:glyoxylase-like metal-dependent hydrolase (beta-lactamase superfamily II)